MRSVSSRIWTRVAVSISYDNNDYTTTIYILNFGIHMYQSLKLVESIFTQTTPIESFHVAFNLICDISFAIKIKKYI